MAMPNWNTSDIQSPQEKVHVMYNNCTFKCYDIFFYTALYSCCDEFDIFKGVIINDKMLHFQWETTRATVEQELTKLQVDGH